mgnify:CR=1 FL=1
MASLKLFFVVDILVVLDSVHAQAGNAITELVKIFSRIVFVGLLRMHLEDDSVLDISVSP